MEVCRVGAYVESRVVARNILFLVLRIPYKLYLGRHQALPWHRGTYRVCKYGDSSTAKRMFTAFRVSDGTASADRGKYILGHVQSSQETTLLQPNERLLRNGLAVICSFINFARNFDSQTSDLLMQKA